MQAKREVAVQAQEVLEEEAVGCGPVGPAGAERWSIAQSQGTAGEGSRVARIAKEGRGGAGKSGLPEELAGGEHSHCLRRGDA